MGHTRLCLLLLTCILVTEVYSDDNFFLITQIVYAQRDTIKTLAQTMYNTEIIETPVAHHHPVRCRACVFSADVYNAIVRANLTWPQLHQVAVQLCVGGFQMVELDGNIMCPPSLLNYGPLLIDIFSTRPDESWTYCTEENVCNPDTPIEGYTPDTSTWPSRRYPYRRYPSTKPCKHGRKPIKIAQITDVHIDSDYDVGSSTQCSAFICCRERYQGSGSAGPYGDYNCNVPVSTMELFLDKVAELDPHFIAHTGDNPTHQLWEETKEGMYNVTRLVARLYRQKFGNSKRIYPTIGNHEVFPSHLYYLDRPATIEFNDLYAEVWKDLANFKPRQEDTIRELGCYTTKVYAKLRIVSYNSNFGYTQNFYNILESAMADQRRMMDWLWEVLWKARRQQEKVIMLGHHPFGHIDTTVRFGKSMTMLCAEFHDIIVLHAIGHEHTDEFQMIYEDYDMAKPVGVVYAAPSLTSFKLVNPSMRVYYLDPDTYQLLNYDQYQLNLQAIAAGAAPEIELVYNFKDEYSVPDMTPSTIGTLAKSIQNDDAIQDQYLHNRWTRTGAEVNCLDTCAYDAVCRVVYSDWEAIQRCIVQLVTVNGAA